MWKFPSALPRLQRVCMTCEVPYLPWKYFEAIFYLTHSPLPNISTPSSPENAIRWPQKPSPGKCQKIPGNSGLPVKQCRERPRERPIQGIPGNSFWGSRTGILGWFSWADENGQSWYVGHGGSNIIYFFLRLLLKTLQKYALKQA